MAKKGQFRPRPGYERLPGRGRLYVDKRTGEIISKRQYTKRTENVKSLEAKAEAYRAMREERGEMPPMSRYNAIVAQYKLNHPKGRVRGEGAGEFKESYHIYTTTRDRSRESNLARVRAGAILGTISPSLAGELYPELADDPALDFEYEREDFD